VLWNPVVANPGTGFGVQGSEFGSDIPGPTDAGVVVEAAAEPAGADWTPVGAITLTGGSSSFHDPQ
jgi:hypothetical protein